MVLCLTPSDRISLDRTLVLEFTLWHFQLLLNSGCLISIRFHLRSYKPTRISCSSSSLCFRQWMHLPLLKRWKSALFHLLPLESLQTSCRFMLVEDPIISSELCCLQSMLICFLLHHELQSSYSQSLPNRCLRLECLKPWMKPNVCLCFLQCSPNITCSGCCMDPSWLLNISRILFNSHWCRHRLCLLHSIQILCDSPIRDLVKRSNRCCSNQARAPIFSWAKLGSLFPSLKCCRWSPNTQPRLKPRSRFLTYH